MALVKKHVDQVVEELPSFATLDEAVDYFHENTGKSFSDRRRSDAAALHQPRSRNRSHPGGLAIAPGEAPHLWPPAGGKDLNDLGRVPGRGARRGSRGQSRSLHGFLHGRRDQSASGRRCSERGANLEGLGQPVRGTATDLRGSAARSCDGTGDSDVGRGPAEP